MSKETTTMMVMYLLGFAACCVWPLQNLAYSMFIILSLVCASIPAVMLTDMEGCIDRSLENLKEHNIPVDELSFKKAPKTISWSYVPMILMMTINGYLFMAAVWAFIYFVMMHMGARMAKRFEVD